MPKDFDAARSARIDKDRSFLIGGETLTYRASVQPEAMIAWSTVDPGSTDEESLPLLDSLVQQFVTDESWPKWQQIRKVTDDYALNLEDITSVISWLVEEQTGHPIELPSGSPAGSATPPTGTPSMDSSPSEEPTTPPASPSADS